MLLFKEHNKKIKIQLQAGIYQIFHWAFAVAAHVVKLFGPLNVIFIIVWWFGEEIAWCLLRLYDLL